MSHYLYRHIRPDKNEPFYIGISRESKTYNRTLDKRRNSIWKNIVSKNNGNFKIDILLDNLSLEEALIKEAEFITLYGRINNKTGILSNILSKGCKQPDSSITEENKEKLRVRMIGNTYSKGKRSKEVIDAMSISRKGRKGPNKDRIMSEEVKKNMSKGHMGNPSIKGKIWINNGIEKKIILKDSIIPEGWSRGRKF